MTPLDLMALPPYEELREVFTLLRRDGYLDCQFVPHANHDPAYVAKFLDVLIEEERTLVDAARQRHPVLYQHSLAREFYVQRLSSRQQALATLFIGAGTAPRSVLDDELADYRDLVLGWTQPGDGLRLPFRIVPVFDHLLVVDEFLSAHPQHVFLHDDSVRMARYLSECDFDDRIVADVGTGTGIQALAARKGGARQILAVDVNPRSVMFAQLNMRLNGIGSDVEVSQGSIERVLEHTDVIVSNPPYMAGRDALALDGGGEWGLDIPLHFVNMASEQRKHLILILETMTEAAAQALSQGLPHPPTHRHVLRRHGERELVVLEFEHHTTGAAHRAS